jgi:methylisocitrate lyase
VKTGIAGLSIEDSTGDAAKPLYDRSLAIERIKAARQAIDADNSGVLLTGRCEAFLWGQADLKLVIDRLTAYAEAGADCLYAPGIKTREDIAAVVKAAHPKPVNLLIGASGLSLQEATDLGVRRISVGGSLARTAWAGFMKAAKEMAEKGTFTELASGYPGGELNKMFK